MNSSDDDYSDPITALREYAAHLNCIRKPKLFKKVFYELMSGGLVWTDETRPGTPWEVTNSLRLIVAYRTSLMIDEPRDEFKGIWKESLQLFPDWIGFREDRREPIPKLMDIYRRDNVSMKKCLRDMEREADSQPKT